MFVRFPSFHPIINSLDWEILILSLNIIVVVITITFSSYYLICFNEVLHVNEEEPFSGEAILLDIEQDITPVNPAL